MKVLKIWLNMENKIVTSCQICGSDKLKDVLNLGYISPVNNVISNKQSKLEQKQYLREWFCDSGL